MYKYKNSTEIARLSALFLHKFAIIFSLDFGVAVSNMSPAVAVILIKIGVLANFIAGIALIFILRAGLCKGLNQFQD